MALNPEEMNRRRERREAQRKQQEKERRRLKLTLIAACVVLALCGFAIFSIARGASQARANVSAELSAVPETTAPTIQAQTEAATESRNTPTNTVIHLRAAGDLNVTNAVVQSGLAVNGYTIGEKYAKATNSGGCAMIHDIEPKHLYNEWKPNAVPKRNA